MDQDPRNMEIPADLHVDLVLTDPPYFTSRKYNTFMKWKSSDGDGETVHDRIVGYFSNPATASKAMMFETQKERLPETFRESIDDLNKSWEMALPEGPYLDHARGLTMNVGNPVPSRVVLDERTFVDDVNRLLSIPEINDRYRALIDYLQSIPDDASKVIKWAATMMLRKIAETWWPPSTLHVNLPITDHAFDALIHAVINEFMPASNPPDGVTESLRVKLKTMVMPRVTPR